ncbi:DUF1553 domain-containing protein [Rubripirellula reticaptiva]|uniref:Planctomycete cytochrome C n=1 Tax=Rubripirellula reticaptiva TaxID=2528013 RepID=A0A5C6EP60_9BACT|nr:DUF1553 domain-containing protein [Rubripirellula reticaptiva]TWU49421.1 Planctomycete cytochrome C [Rubripirellula reticaptiva]
MSPLVPAGLFVMIVAGGAALPWCIADAADGVSGTAISFPEQIQPLLARDCFSCHGPDASTREADLRLDIESAAKQHAVVAGDATSSELVSRIYSTDPDSQMPPPETGHRLSDSEKALIRGWIDQGAGWQSHWAFEPIVAPKMSPAGDDKKASPIDRFVSARRKEAGLDASPPTDRATLLRRAYFDLVGLPPSSTQIQRFINDDREDAFEIVVDELLRSPHYGEQMAVEWLDAARYADTNGYQNDFNRSMWLWRDWVIAAFNENLPYDEFIVDQIAGDMLPAATERQLVATGFNRNNRSVTEGGSIEAEWRVENCVDRVETTAGAFLGLTMGCARCHDHKYDPVSQKEFYQFYAFFNNVDERGVYNEARGNVGPQIAITTPAHAARLQDLSQQVAIQEKLVGVDVFPKTIAGWRAELESSEFENRDSKVPEAIFRYPNPGATLAGAESPVGKSILLKGLAGTIDIKPEPEFPFEQDRPWSWSVWVHGDARGALFGKMDVGNAYRGVDGLILSDGRLKIHLIHRWPQNAIAVLSGTKLPGGQWTCITVTYDGSSKAYGLRVYFDGQSIEVTTEQDALTQTLATDVPFRIGQRSTSEFLTGQMADFRLFEVTLTDAQVAQHVRSSIVQHHDQLQQAKAGVVAAEPMDQADPMVRYVSRVHDSPSAQKLKKLRAELNQLHDARPTTMVMRDQAEYRETFLLIRGQYDLPDTSEPLWPAIPAALPPLADDQPASRLGLARWMVDDRNPLTARVAVNRAWQKFFGRGLVESADNFGVQGAPPTHPNLLNYLADDFRQHGWDLKRLHKQIVLSDTYQQSSKHSAESLASDPDNRWLSRGPRYRLSAEQIRDQALAISGLLVDRHGGPAVFPYQPAGLWEELAGGASGGPYVQSERDDLYRRSLYTFRKRTVSHPTLATFGAPSWEVCQLKRSRTNTPLQSLALLNDVTYVEAARHLATRVLTHDGDAENQSPTDAIGFGFQTVVLRQPTASEIETLVRGYADRLAFYQSHPQEAEAMCEVGDSPCDESCDRSHLAAMTSVAAILLNLDEVLTKQ